MRDRIAAFRRQLVVDGSEGESPAVALDVEDVDPGREQPWDEQPLLVVRVAEVMELVTDVRHLEPAHDLPVGRRLGLQVDDRQLVRLRRRRWRCILVLRLRCGISNDYGFLIN